jgi:phage terminase large subunit
MFSEQTKRRIVEDPMVMATAMWPDVRFYDKQEEIIYSVENNIQTFVSAGHQLGKDFVTGFIILRYFLIHHPVRIVTTSVKDDHLRVLWGEIGRYIDTCAIPLKREDGGPLVVQHRELKKVMPNGKICKISYCIGLVSEKGEGMAGHHARHTLLVVDEASGVEDLVFERSQTWMKKCLVIGNPYPCSNFFFNGVMGGDLGIEEMLKGDAI